MKVGLTGANGFIGGHLAQALRQQGHEPVFLTRGAPKMAGAAHLLFDLAGEPPDPEAFARMGIAALVHCAWDFRVRGEAGIRRVNIEGTRRLLHAAGQGGVRNIVNISTMSAFAGCRSLYGRAKLELETDVARAGGVSLRPGLVWAERPAGMVGLLDRLAERLPVVPMIGSGRTPLCLSHVDDLADLVLRCLGTPGPVAGRTLTAAWQHAVPLRDILRQRAQAKGRSPLFLPVPWPLVWATIKCVEVLPLDLGLRSDSVIGFVYADHAPQFDPAAFAAIGFAGFRPFP